MSREKSGRPHERPDGKEQRKTVLSFAGRKKSLPLARCNWESVADATTEEDSDAWMLPESEDVDPPSTRGAKV